ncbi:9117_t:CDS:2 [Diversispora eburnea]|uniref:9117_t:CDS:1 n=1 Tax=Diversispora eburnea TaxID=1213867 RepID=A0A9N8VIN9_9GLOM|nr:9117_t:CDS:2 [Diversispora eburnea]
MTDHSNPVKTRKIRVKNSAKLDIIVQPPTPLMRSNTMPGKSSTSNGIPRVPRSKTLGLPEKEKARSDDGFHSDSDSNQSAHSVNSNLSTHSSMSYYNRAPSIKSDTIIRVRSKSSLGSASSDLSEKSHLDNLNLATLAANRQLQVDKQAEEARKNRKIADLEISIKSLISINSELDAANKKLNSEIIELKRKLQINDSIKSEIHDDELSEATELAKDVRFFKIYLMTDKLLQDAQEALALDSSKLIGSRVLTNAEIAETNFDNSEIEIKLEQQHDSDDTTNTTIPSTEKSTESKDRVQEVIKQLLTIAKQDNDNRNSKPPQPEIKVMLLYELQELLGYGDEESSKNMKENRRSLPNLPSENYFHDNEGDSDNAKFYRRLSSPIFKTNTMNNNRSDNDVNPLKAKNLHPHGAESGRPSFWASSLGLLNPWKERDK